MGNMKMNEGNLAGGGFMIDLQFQLQTLPKSSI